MLIKLPTFTNDPAHAVAYVNSEFVSVVLPRRNSSGEFRGGCLVYTVGDADPVSVKEDIDVVAGMIREAQRKEHK